MLNKPSPAPAPQITNTLIWDEAAIFERRAKDLLELGDAASESEALERASHDYAFIEWEFDAFLEKFERILRRISSKGRYFVAGENMGWRHLSGTAVVEACDARAFITRVFPKT